MSDASARVAAADVGDPFAEDRRIDQGVDPHGLADIGTLKRDPLDRLARNHRDLAGSHHLDAMVGFPQKGVLKIDSLPFHMDGADLARASGDNLRAYSVPAEQHAGMRCLLIFADHVVASLEPLHAVRQGKQSCAVIGAERAVICEPADHRLQRGRIVHEGGLTCLLSRDIDPGWSMSPYSPKAD